MRQLDEVALQFAQFRLGQVIPGVGGCERFEVGAERGDLFLHFVLARDDLIDRLHGYGVERARNLPGHFVLVEQIPEGVDSIYS